MARRPSPVPRGGTLAAQRSTAAGAPARALPSPSPAAAAPPSLRRARLLGHRPALSPVSGEAVQRLVGFEIESSNLPATPAAAGAVDRVTNFLTRRVDGPIGAPEATFKRVRDHSRGMIDAVSAVRGLWADRLLGAHQERLRVADPPNTPIVEYVTQTFDERHQADTRAGGLFGFFQNQVLGTDSMDRTIGDIATEIDDSKQNLRERAGVQIGMPPLADWQAAAEYYQLQLRSAAAYSRDRARDLGQLAHQDIRAQVNQDEHHVQATIGILPEKINAFLAGAANQNSVTATPISAQDPRLAGNAPYKFIADTMTRVDQEVDELVADLTARGSQLPTDNLDEQAALGGFLRLLLYVTTGDAARKGPGNVGGNNKNLVSFLPKTPLHLVEKQLPKAVRPSNQRTYVLPWTFNAIVQKVHDAHRAVGAYMQTLPGGDVLTQAQIEGTDLAARLGTDNVRDYLRTVLAGTSDPNLVLVAATNIDPEDPSKGGREGVKTGNWLFNRRTRAVALETRHTAAQVARGGLVGFAREIAALVRGAHE